jgi:hypothetical protein
MEMHASRRKLTVPFQLMIMEAISNVRLDPTLILNFCEPCSIKHEDCYLKQTCL